MSQRSLLSAPRRYTHRPPHCDSFQGFVPSLPTKPSLGDQQAYNPASHPARLVLLCPSSAHVSPVRPLLPFCSFTERKTCLRDDDIRVASPRSVVQCSKRLQLQALAHVLCRRSQSSASHTFTEPKLTGHTSHLVPHWNHRVERRRTR